jgi:hypothetical protein
MVIWIVRTGNEDGGGETHVEGLLYICFGGEKGLGISLI